MSDVTDLRTFVRVIDHGGFAAASKDLRITPSAVSKLITRLEDRLGVRLLHRTTRRLSLTPEGETYYLRAREILAAIEDAEAEVSRAGQRPRGRLRVNCVPAFALNQLAAKLSVFLERCPEVELELALTDRIVDLIAENADVGIRVGVIADPSLIVKKFGEIRRNLVASPDYLARRGTPRTPEELRNHDCIVVSTLASAHAWPFRAHGQTRTLEITHRVLVDNGDAALRLAIAGCGITRLGDLTTFQAVHKGLLRPVLVDSHVGDPVPLSAVYPQGRHRMPKVRAFLDFLAEHFSHVPWRHAAVA
jgi:DNA-binding transcriptional LysR family regulator